MTIKEKLENAQERSQELVNKLNQLENDKQEIIKEFLRYEGEIRVLKELENVPEGILAKQLESIKNLPNGTITDIPPLRSC